MADGKTDLAEEITCRSFKVSKYKADTKVNKRLDDLDEQAAMEAFLNVRVPDWLLAHYPAWGWIVIHAHEFEGIGTMGEFNDLISSHLTPSPDEKP